MIENTNNKKSENLIPRPPVVVVVGHIDHGKTKLLDYIRKANVVEGESGGITQHVGAYEVEAPTKDGGVGRITFLDTPGHEAFSKIRARGAKAADVAILVVAADEGVKPQTEESINALKAAGIPFVVAINKIDKEGASPERVKAELAEREVFVEGWGGQVPVAEISALNGTGVDELLETVLLVAEMEELRADSSATATGVVIESNLDPKRGNAATLIIQNGTLKSGEFILAGEAIAPVRIFEDFAGRPLKEATFSSPVRIVGFDSLPPVGEEFNAFISKKEAERALAVKRVSGEKKDEIKERATKKEEEVAGFSVILKADVAGSLEALEGEIEKLSSEKAEIRIIKSEVGNIGEDDLKMALSAEGVIVVGFKVKIDKAVSEPLKQHKIAFKTFDIIYEVSDWLRTEIEARLPQEMERTDLGRAKILKVFKKAGNKQVVGGRVMSGTIKDKAKFDLIRNENKLDTGTVLELQHGKMKVSEVEKDNEFGVQISVATTVAPGDILEIFEEKSVKVKL